MKRKTMQRSFCHFALVILATSQLVRAAGFESFETYQGKPYHDSRYSGEAQPIPGKVQCAYYDLGGEGIAYHDTDAKNNGSGALNPADGTYLNEFRMPRASTSHTRNSTTTSTTRNTTWFSHPKTSSTLVGPHLESGST